MKMKPGAENSPVYWKNAKKKNIFWATRHNNAATGMNLAIVLKKDCSFNNDFLKLYKKFCPGPITFILDLKKSSKISEIVTNKKNTLAVRFPKHPVTRNLLKKLDFPLAAPSANPSSKVSAVSSGDVKDDFGKKIKYVLEGGKSSIGLESTIIDTRKNFEYRIFKQ